MHRLATGRNFLAKTAILEGAHIDTWCSGCTFDGQSDLIGIVLHAKRLALCGSDIKVWLTHYKFPSFSAMNILNGNWLIFFLYATHDKQFFIFFLVHLDMLCIYCVYKQNKSDVEQLPLIS